MERIEKTVFLSYRRTNASWALAIYQNLTHHGFDVFFDYNGIASGDFEQVIVQNIKARAHFIVLLAPSALERCVDPGDWLRREIESALETGRNIVPLMLEGFDFSAPAIHRQLTSSLAPLKRYNALRIYTDYFDDAMERLRTKFLSVPLTSVLHPASADARQAATAQQSAVRTVAAVPRNEMTAEQVFEKAYAASDVDEKIRLFTEALQLKPGLVEAFINRGVQWSAKGEVDRALEDFSQAIRIKPDYAMSYYNRALTLYKRGDLKAALQDWDHAVAIEPGNPQYLVHRGIARHDSGDDKGALQDYNKAIQLNPDDAMAFYNRAAYHRDKGQAKAALRDFSEVLRIWPNDSATLTNRAILLHKTGDLDGAMRDLNEAIRLMPDLAYAYYYRGLVRAQSGDREGALEDFDEHIRIITDNPNAYYNRGLARRESGDIDGAERDFAEAKRLGHK